MNHKNQTNSYTDFFYYIFRNILLVSIPFVIIFALILSIPHSSATVSGASADSLTLSLPTSCTLSSVVNSAHNATLISGTYTSDIGKTTITTLCNDGNGYAIYASGISNGVVGNNALISSVSSNHNIATGIYEQGDTTSSWAMKLGNIESDTSPTPPVIEQGYNNTYGLVPSTWTKVAGRQSGTTDMITGSTFTTTYAVYTAPTQHAGTYTGQVAYLLVHSYNDNLLPNEPYFMQDIANWKDDLVEDVAVQAIDKRDFKSYSVTKLKDGHIWMTQNLDLNLDPAKPLTSNDTDLIDHSKTRAYADGYDYDETTGITTWTPADSAGTVKFNGTSVPWNSTNNTPASAIKTDGPSTGHESLGNYYNWTAAIASNNSSSLTSDTSGNISNNPQNSICPKGWRLPTISNQSETVTGSTNEFARLNYLYNHNLANTDTGLVTTPLWLTKSGYIWNNVLSNNIGRYNSSTPQSSNNNYHLSFSNNSVEPTRVGGQTRSVGAAIRCVAR